MSKKFFYIPGACSVASNIALDVPLDRQPYTGAGPARYTGTTTMRGVTQVGKFWISHLKRMCARKPEQVIVAWYVERLSTILSILRYEDTRKDTRFVKH